jgi:hypothetical protein
MHLLKRTRNAEHTEKGAPICAFVTYIDPEKPVLLRRMGWEIADDIHDDFYDSVSTDNGLTWSTPRSSLKLVAENGGYTMFFENTIFYNAERDRLVHLAGQIFQKAELNGYDRNYSPQIRITVAEPKAFLDGTAQPSLVSDFGIRPGVTVSFCHPFQDSRQRILISVEWQARKSDRDIPGQEFPVRDDMPDILTDVWETAYLIGTWNADNSIEWNLGNPIPYEFARSSRGMCEGTIAELEGGRLVTVLRGSNAAWLEKPGYKWISFSDDGGINWSLVEPLACDDGSLLESSATGSLLIRSFTNQKLYWIGNLCTKGERAYGNMPRSPLVIAEVQEEPFALKRETIAVIGECDPGEDPEVQHSNFRCYQDRVSGDIVLYLTRYSERGSADGNWIKADNYCFRVSLAD